MHRFSILYFADGQYQHLTYPTRVEAETTLDHFLATHKGVPIGIYDAKTELFYWDSKQQNEYSRMSIEEQGKLGNEAVYIIQTLRGEEEEQSEELREGDVLMRPLPLTIPKVTLPLIVSQLATLHIKKRKRRVLTRPKRLA